MHSCSLRGVLVGVLWTCGCLSWLPLSLADVGSGPAADRRLRRSVGDASDVTADNASDITADECRQSRVRQMDKWTYVHGHGTDGQMSLDIRQGTSRVNASVPCYGGDTVTIACVVMEVTYTSGVYASVYNGCGVVVLNTQGVFF